MDILTIRKRQANWTRALLLTLFVGLLVISTQGLSLWSTAAIVAIVVVFLMGRRFGEWSRHYQAVNQYFLWAAQLYMKTNREDDKLAAITAAKMASSEQRKGMVDFLDVVCSGDYDSNKKRALQQEITAKDWDRADVMRAKKELGKVNKTYLDVLERDDETFFHRKYSQYMSMD